ncbi:MAG TPA: hypothetical protein VF604_10900 [Pyrinomonadaceae bacterium]
MNKCPQCLNVLSKAGRECRVCGAAISSEFAVTPPQKFNQPSKI